MRNLPLVGFQKQFLLRHGNSITGCQCTDDLLELFFVRFAKVDTNPKTIYQIKLLLYCIGGMQIIVICDLQLVCGTLTDKITPVTCGIDQDIVRLRLNAAFDNGL